MTPFQKVLPAAIPTRTSPENALRRTKQQARCCSKGGPACPAAAKRGGRKGGANREERRARPLLVNSPVRHVCGIR
jgi:hypothetical protein